MKTEKAIRKRIKRLTELIENPAYRLYILEFKKARDELFWVLSD